MTALSAEPGIVLDAQRDSREEVIALVEHLGLIDECVAKALFDGGHGRASTPSIRSLAGAEPLLERGEPALQVGLHRVPGDPHGLGDLVDPKILVVAEHEGAALAVREIAQCGDHLMLVLAQLDLVLGRRSLIVEREVMA